MSLSEVFGTEEITRRHHRNFGSVEYEKIASICSSVNGDIDTHIRNYERQKIEELLINVRQSNVDGAADLCKKLEDLSSEEHRAAVRIIRTDLVNVHLREYFSHTIGSSKTQAIYNTLHSEISSVDRKNNVAVSFFKLCHFKECVNAARKMSDDDMCKMVLLVDGLANAPEKNQVLDEIRQAQLEEKYAVDSATLREKITSAVLPDPNAGIGESLKNVMSLIKDKLGIQSERKKATDELCLDLISSPVTSFIGFAMACIGGSTGLAVVSVPLVALWQFVSVARDITADENSTLDSILRSASPRVLTVDNCDFRVEQNTMGPVGSLMTDTRSHLVYPPNFMSLGHGR